jgi:hypothetical protein
MTKDLVEAGNPELQVFSQTTFNELLRRRFPELIFRRSHGDLAVCNECAVLTSALMSGCCDEQVRELVRAARCVHIQLLMAIRASLSLLSRACVVQPSSYLYIIADQTFPAFLPSTAELPKAFQRERGLPTELLAVAVAGAAPELFLYQSTSALEWEKSPARAPARWCFVLFAF